MGQHERCFHNFQDLYHKDLGHWKILDTLLSVQTNEGQFSLNSANSVFRSKVFPGCYMEGEVQQDSMEKNLMVDNLMDMHSIQNFLSY